MDVSISKILLVVAIGCLMKLAPTSTGEGTERFRNFFLKKDLAISANCFDNLRANIYRLTYQQSSRSAIDAVSLFYNHTSNSHYEQALKYAVRYRPDSLWAYSNKWKDYIGSSNLHNPIDIVDIFALSKVFAHEYTVYNSSYLLHQPLHFLARGHRRNQGISHQKILVTDKSVCFLENMRRTTDASGSRPHTRSQSHRKLRKMKDDADTAKQSSEVHHRIDSDGVKAPVNFRRAALDEAVLLQNRALDYRQHAFEMRMNQETTDARRSSLLKFALSSDQSEDQFLGSLYRNFGLVRVQMPADGHCGFYAILYAFLNRVASAQEVSNFRHQLAAHMQKHKQLYQAWSWAHSPSVGPRHLSASAMADDDQSIVFHFENFLARLRHDQWLNDLHLHAICNMLNIKVGVFDRRPFSQVLKVFEPNADHANYGDHVDVVFLFHQSHFHFDFLF